MSVLVAVELVQVTCCHEGCGCVFGLSRAHYTALRETHAWFHCPNGHSQRFAIESEKERLERLLREEREQREREREVQRNLRSRMEREHAATKGRLTKLSNRVKKGVCPFCNRTFGNLARHMATKHTERETCEHEGKS